MNVNLAGLKPYYLAAGQRGNRVIHYAALRSTSQRLGPERSTHEAAVQDGEDYVNGVAKQALGVLTLVTSAQSLHEQGVRDIGPHGEHSGAVLA